MNSKVLITAPLKQDRGIFREFQDALDRLIIPGGVTVDRFFVVNDCDKIIPDIRGDHIVINTGDSYGKTVNDHIWTPENLDKMPRLRNATIQRALDGGYDYWFSIDTDLIVQPETLQVTKTSSLRSSGRRRQTATFGATAGCMTNAIPPDALTNFGGRGFTRSA